MDDLQLGQIITETRYNEGGVHRDAVHIAVAPVVASERLAPGQDIGFVGDGLDLVRYASPYNFGPRTAESLQYVQPIGIVDPFLRGPVFEGDRFWMWLYPNTITSLRHDWTHPAFTTPTSVPEIATEDFGSDYLGVNVAGKWNPNPDRAVEKRAAQERTSAEATSVSEFWLRDFAANQAEIPYDDLLAGCRAFVQDGKYMWEGEGLGVTDEFWDHYENATGTKVAADKRGTLFSCSC